MSALDDEHWSLVDEGWGRRAADFATLSEPSNCREYVGLHHQLAIGADDHVLDVACGAGLAVELARLRSPRVAGIDASRRLVAIARMRNPDARIVIGDMHALPWDDGTFDVVTSFRGVWRTTPRALDEIRRVLVPGGRVGITVWGHIKRSTGSWALAPFSLAAPSKVEHQAEMASLGRPGVGERLLSEAGFVDVTRVDLPFAWEFPDPEGFARALASTGPAHEAISHVGEDEFLRVAMETASARARRGEPLRAELPVVALMARTEETP